MDHWRIVHTSLAYFTLMLSIISFWVRRSTWIWGGFLLLSCLFAYLSSVIEPIALAPIGGLMLCHLFLSGQVKGVVRFILVLIAATLSIALSAHLLPGFHNVPIIQGVQISPHGYPMHLYLNFDKPFIAIFVIAFSLPLLPSWRALRELLPKVIGPIFIGIILMAGVALLGNFVAWDPKFPPIFFLFALINLLFVTLVEEVFWRGFIQRELFRAFGRRGALAHLLSIVITASLFSLLHYRWIPSFPFLGLIFIGGVLYGALYQWTRSIEAAAGCHWLFNMTHFLLFTYPALQLS